MVLQPLTPQLCFVHLSLWSISKFSFHIYVWLFPSFPLTAVPLMSFFFFFPQSSEKICVFLVPTKLSLSGGCRVTHAVGSFPLPVLWQRGDTVRALGEGEMGAACLTSSASWHSNRVLQRDSLMLRDGYRLTLLVETLGKLAEPRKFTWKFHLCFSATKRSLRGCLPCCEDVLDCSAHFKIVLSTSSPTAPAGILIESEVVCAARSRRTWCRANTVA